MRVIVVPYDPAWPRPFEQVCAQLSATLATVSLVGIEHVGSTAVPGLAGKPVIDVDVIVTRENVAAAIDALEQDGYVSLGITGVPDRHALAAPDDAPRRNVYITVEGCLSLRNHLGVRDVLRSDATLRDEYGGLKLRLGEREYADIEGYVVDKSPVVQRILERAGLRGTEREEIAEINRPAG